MSSDFDQDALISIFIAEATDGLNTLWNALNPADGRVPSAEALAEQFVLAHRVKGAAYQYGFTQIAELGAVLETALEHIHEQAEEDLPGLVAELCDLVRRMQHEVEGIGGTEPADSIATESQPLPTQSEPEAEDGPPGDSQNQDSAAEQYLLPELDEEVLGYFAPEAQEYLDTIESDLLRLEKDPSNPETIQALFRTVHTLKGSAYTVGFQVIGDVTHPVEDLLGAIRDGRHRVTPESIDLVFRAVDIVRLLMKRDPGLVHETKQKVALLMDALRHLDDGPTASAEQPDAGELEPTSANQPAAAAPAEQELEVFDSEPVEEGLGAKPIYGTVPRPEVEVEELLGSMEHALDRIEKDAQDREALQALYEQAQGLTRLAEVTQMRPLGDLAHLIQELVAACGEERSLSGVRMAELSFRAIEAVRRLVGDDPHAAEEVRETIVGLRAELEEQVASDANMEPDEESAEQPDQSEPITLDSTLGQQPRSQRRRTAQQEAEDVSVIRVSQKRLERLLNLVGELVISRGRLDERLKVLEQLSLEVMAYRNRMLETVRAFETKHEFSVPSNTSLPGELKALEVPSLAEFGTLELDKYDDFNILARRISEVATDVSESMSQLNDSIRQAREDMGQLQRLTTGMRDEIAHTRMVPIGTPFVRFRRAVREMARTTGKEVNLVTSGEHTEVDSTVVDRLVDPLVHMVRNAVYHGIEPAAQREANGKPRHGTISLRASHSGSQVMLEIEDDGAGMSLEKMKRRAIELGLLRPEAADTLSRSETINLIFLPGFSTAATVGDQAGRGMGMDVVKQTIQGMNGNIEVDTVEGKGTRFVLQLPLTLLVSTALLVRVGEHRYAIPLPAVREVILPAPGELQSHSGRTLLQIMDETIEVESLAWLLHDEPVSLHEPRPIVIARTATGALGLAVDELLGRQEIVIKTLGTLKAIQKSCFGGATIDPRGQVILVLDVSRLTSRTDQPVLPSEAQPETVRMLESGVPQEAGAESGGRSVLLIDDSLSIRKFVGRMLENAGYIVDTAADGEEALRKVAMTSYRLIITDLEMPKVNGYEVLQALRSRPQTQATPVIVMTTRAGDKHRQVAMSMGASAYVTKPVEERALIRELSRWVTPELPVRG